MTNSEIQIILDEHHDLIVTMSRICHRRLRKPTIYDAKDLTQEAMCVCIRALPSFDPNQSSIRTFIFNCIVKHFANLVKFSWYKKHDNSQYRQEHPHKVQIDPATIAQVKEFYAQLTPTEIEYIDLILANSHKAQVRREMGITYFREKQILADLFWKSIPTL